MKKTTKMGKAVWRQGSLTTTYYYEGEEREPQACDEGADFLGDGTVTDI